MTRPKKKPRPYSFYAPTIACPRCGKPHRLTRLGADPHCEPCQEDRWKARPCLRCGRMMMTVPEQRFCRACGLANEGIGEVYGVV